MAPTTAILDNFNRANGAPGANWPGPIRSSRTLLTIASNALGCANSSGSTEEAYWTSSFSANQEVFVTLSALPTVYGVVRLCLRIQSPNASSPSFYILEYDHTLNSLVLFYYNGSTYAQIGSTVTLTLAAGDKLLLRAVGSALVGEAFQSGAWSQVISGTDSNITGAGYAGVSINDNTGKLDDFGAGALVSAIVLPATRRGGWSAIVTM